MIRNHSSLPPIILEAQRHGFKTFLNSDYDMNIIGARNPEPRHNEFDDLLHVVYKKENRFVERIFPCTIDAGKHYMENPARRDGTAVLMHPYQYRSAFTFGKHRGKYDCLVQRFAIPVWREKGGTMDIDEFLPSEAHAIQIHRSSSSETSTQVDKWSAGCIALQTGFSKFMELCRKQEKNVRSPVFSLTIVKGRFL